MTLTSISQIEKPIDESHPTAIIYSIGEIGEYIVEIRYKHQQYYIEKDNKPERFGNLGEAKAAAREHNVTQGFLALSKTYEETDAVDVSQYDNANRFDYMPVTV